MIIEIADDRIMQIARKGHAAMAQEEREAYTVEQVREAFVASFPILLDSSLSTSDDDIRTAPEHRALPFNEALGLTGIGHPIAAMWEDDGRLPRVDFPALGPGSRPGPRVILQGPTLGEFVEEVFPVTIHRESEITIAARKAHAVMQDRDAYGPVAVEMALTYYLAVYLSGFLSDVESWAQGPVEGRPTAFNDHLESARAYLLGAHYGKTSGR